MLALAFWPGPGAAVERPPREVAVTFDDLPVASRHGDAASQSAITARLLDAIENHSVPATGFVNEGKLYTHGAVDSEKVALLEQWLRGEGLTREMVESRGGKLRFFRHTFLHTGPSLEIKLSLERFLARRGYRVAPVTTCCCCTPTRSTPITSTAWRA